MIKRIFFSLVIFLFLATPAFADFASRNPIMQDEGTTVAGSGRIYNFTGTGVAVTFASGKYVITIGGGGAPTDADYLVGTANGSLSAEIVVGTTPGGSLGGTWASPTIDDLFIKNDASDTMIGVLTSDGLTLGTNEYLTFGTETFTFDNLSSIDFELSDDLNINDTDPHLKLAPTVGDAFETYAYGNEWYFTNVTDSIVLWRIKADNNIYLERDIGGNLTVKGHSAIGSGASIDQNYDGLTVKSILNMRETFTDMSSDYIWAHNVIALLNPSIEPVAVPYALNFEVDTVSGNAQNFPNGILGIWGGGLHQGSGTVSNFRGLEFDIFNSSTGTITTAEGVFASVSNNSTGTVGTGSGIQVQLNNNNASGIFTTGYGLEILTPVNIGTFTNNYGVYIKDQSTVGSTNSYNLYSVGTTAKNLFEGFLLTKTKLGILETGATPTKYTYFQGGDQTVDLTYTLPTAYPASIAFLKISDAGVMTTDVNTYEPAGVAVADITDASANGRSLISAANYATMRGLLDLEAGTDFYSMTAADTAFEAELDNSAGLLGALNDETGIGLAVFNNSPTFADDIQLGLEGADGILKIYSEQGATDYTASLYANAAMTSAASFFLPADEPAATSFINMTTGGVMGFIAPNAGTDLTADLEEESVAEVYDATGWDADTGVAQKNDIRDKIETMGGGGDSISKSITQATHGFAVGNVLKFVTTYGKAQADSSANAEVVGIVSAVADVNTFTLLYGGYISTLSGLTANSVYFLDDDTAGLLTTTEPTDVGDISKPILIAVSTTAGYVFNFRGKAISASIVDTKCIYWENPIATDDFKSIWYTPIAVTLTQIWAESDQTVTFMLQVDDGSPADVDSVDLAPAAGVAIDTSLDGDKTMAAGDRLDLATTSVANTPTWCSICFSYTKD